MTETRADDAPNPDGSAGWEALPPDGDQPEQDEPADDATDDARPQADGSEGDRPDRPRS